MRSAGRFNSLLVVSLLVAGAAFAGTAPGQNDTSALHPSRAKPSIASPKQQTDVWSQKTFSLRGLDGVTHTLEDWKGKVIMLNFWATWCAPCQAEIADFVSFQEKFQTEGLQIIGLGFDDEHKLRNVQRTLGINYPILVADPDRNSKLMGQWGNRSGIVPYTVVIDRNGIIIYLHYGPLHQDIFNEQVLPLLKNEQQVDEDSQ